jgi:hypothetical protein
MQKWHNRVVPIGPATTIRSGQTGQGNDTGSWLDWSHGKIWAALGQTVIIIAPPRKGKSGTRVFQARQITWRIHPSPSFPFERDGAGVVPQARTNPQAVSEYGIDTQGLHAGNYACQQLEKPSSTSTSMRGVIPCPDLLAFPRSSPTVGAPSSTSASSTTTTQELVINPGINFLEHRCTMEALRSK